MKVKLYELSATDKCREKRAFGHVLETELKDHVRRSGLIKEAIHEILGGADKEKVKKKMKEGFDTLGATMSNQNELLYKQALKEVLRYTDSEAALKRNMIDLHGKNADVDIDVDLSVTVNPDFIFITPGDERYDGRIEIVKIKCSRPNETQANVRKNLELYAMLKLARKLVKPGKRFLLSSSIYFLKKNNDRGENAQRPFFDPDFFNTTKAGNIITLSEEYNGMTSWTETDEGMKEEVERFYEGIPKEECRDDDCRTCELYDICKYEEPPIQIKKEPVVKSVSDISLTSEQMEAIEYEKGVCRINAGAGAGKTMVVALRTVTLLNKGVKPEEIALMTFTNSGAEEMRSRIQLYNDDFGTGEDVSAMTVTTFHAFGNEILAKEYARLGFSNPPKVIDDVEKYRIITDLLDTKFIQGLNYSSPTVNMPTAKGATIMAAKVFNIIKEKGYGSQDVMSICSDLGPDVRFASKTAVEGLVRLFDDYDFTLRENNLIDFSDMEVMLFELLKDDPYYLERFGFRHLIVDEFQDSSEGQIFIIRKMMDCPTFESLMVVGDDAQSIFSSLRGTTPEYMINFKKYIGKEVDDIYLLENHRSTPEIIEFANKVIANNKYRVIKNLVSTRPHGKPVTVHGFLTKDEEQNYVLDGIKDHIASGTKAEDIAVICATKYELASMASLLRRSGIPAVMLNPETMIDNSRVRAAVALLKAVQNPKDKKDILTYKNALIGGGILKKSDEELVELLSEEAADVAAVALLDENAKKKRIIEKLEAIDHYEDEVYQAFLNGLKTKSVEKMIEYTNDFFLFGPQAAYRRTHNYPGVVLTTAHSSKGLEWPVCYCMISNFHREDCEKHFKTMEEQRRLFFVAATRARDELYVTAQYISYGKAGDYSFNRFLEEAYNITGQVFAPEQILKEKELKALEEKVKRAEKRREAIEEARKTDYLDESQKAS